MSLVTVKKGDLFASGCDALVNPVNCVGVHGKGLALEFKKRFPRAVESFSTMCRLGEVTTGHVYNEHTGQSQPRWILFFPTKDHWRHPSQMDYIEEGLEDLVSNIQELEVTSVAIPALGCGWGQLRWSEVLPRILHHAPRMLVRVDIFEPGEP